MSENRRLDSWKEIAAYLGVSVRTAQRWEKLEELPVKRHRHAKLSSTYAYTKELDAWWGSRPDTPQPKPRGVRPELIPPFADHARSIAVLPFSNLDRDQETEIISDGLTEDLITALSQVEQLKVVARSSTFYFKDKAVDVRDIGAKLGVETVLEGSVRREGRRLRVTAQLIYTADGCHLWAQRFDREIDHLLDLQDELARAITQRLRIQLAGRRSLVHRRTRDPHLYNLFLRGRYFWNQRTREGLEKALGCYQQAVRGEPDFAPAHAGVADCYAFLWAHGGYQWGEVIRAAEAAAAEALAIDPALSDAHTSSGLTHILRYDFRGASQAYQRALDLNPSDVRARHWGAMMAANLGRLGEAIAEMRRALELDPFGMTANQDLGRILYFAGRYDEAIEQLRHTLDIAPNAYWARIYLGFAYVQLERFKEALAVFDSDPTLRAFVHGRMGQPDDARQALQHRKRSSGRDRTWLALLHLSLGDDERAVEHLRTASEQHEVAYLEMCSKVQPLFEPLRTYPEFDALPPA